MFRSFWFYFNSIPVVFAVLFFTLSFVLLNSGPKPVFSDAVAYCKDVSNDKWADYERTYQDKCVDEFMGENSFLSTTSELFWVLGLLLSIVGIAFIVPLSIYLLLSWRMHRYGHY
jgi:hypothetical protein